MGYFLIKIAFDNTVVSIKLFFTINYNFMQNLVCIKQLHDFRQILDYLPIYSIIAQFRWTYNRLGLSVHKLSSCVFSAIHSSSFMEKIIILLVLQLSISNL